MLALLDTIICATRFRICHTHVTNKMKFLWFFLFTTKIQIQNGVDEVSPPNTTIKQFPRSCKSVSSFPFGDDDDLKILSWKKSYSSLLYKWNDIIRTKKWNKFCFSTLQIIRKLLKISWNFIINILLKYFLFFMRFSCFIVYLIDMKRDPIFFPLRQRTRHPFATSRHQWPLFFLIWIYSWGGSDVWGPSIVAVVPPYCQAVLCHLCILSSNLTTTTMLVMILQVKNHNAFVL